MEWLPSLSPFNLLIPPLRLMTAAMWEVVRLRSFNHYGKVEEFVSMIAEAIPELLSNKQMSLLVLGLRTKVTLQLLRSEQQEDVRSVETYLDRLQQSCSKQVETGNEPLEHKFLSFVKNLLEDPDGREHFLKNVLPVEYGADFDAALETVVCVFFTRLEELLPIPDFKQTALWISDTPTVLEEYVQCVSKVTDLKMLLSSKKCIGKLSKTDISVSCPSEDRLFTSLSQLPSLSETRTSSQTTDSESESSLHCESTCLELQDGAWPPNKQTQTLESDVTRQTEDKRREGVDELDIVECDSVSSSATTQAPSNSFEVSTSSTSVIGTHAQQRVAHKCPQCGKCYIYRCQLLEHQRLHTGENPYKCSQCGKAFRRTSNLSAHRRMQCTKAAYVCIKCGNSFESIQDKFRHQCPQQVQRFDCPQCGKSFKKMYLLGKHQLTHTQQQSNQCMQCGKFFSSSKCLAAHELRHNQQRTQICTLCAKGFKNKSDLNLHMRSHTKPFKCTYCGKSFSVSGNLNIHIRTHTGEKPYLCSDCGKAFASAGELQSCTHTGEKPYKCSVCAKSFTMESKLTLHMRVHTGERPYVCAECGKGFLSGSELKKHTLSHSGVRPYACQLCAKTYTCLNHLKRHLKTHRPNPVT